MARKPHKLSSRELLDRIGLNDENLSQFMDEEPLEDLSGDLGAALQDAFREFDRVHRFNPGDLVTWKPGLKNRRTPRYGQPAAVMARLEQPIYDNEADSGSAYFHEPLDVVLGVIWERDPGRGELLTFHFDSRRFQPWE
jgi:hypothetical protein